MSARQDDPPGRFKNASLTAAKRAKNDEYYTQWAYIESEMNAYLEYNPDVFRDKVILLPCDDPEWSNFTKYFALHFQTYGIKRLISTSYAPDSKPSSVGYQPTLFETASEQFDESRTRANGKLFVLDRSDVTGDGVVNIADIQWRYLDGDGDFRSDEITKLRDEADIIITNPPFSLFRVFLAWLVEGGVRFSVIGTSHVATYKDVFPLIKEKFLWKGATSNSSAMVFGVPKGTPVNQGYQDTAARLGYPSDNDYDYTVLGNSSWFTNLDHGRRHERLQLMTLEDNRKFSKHNLIRESGYQRYDNFDAIEVPWVDAIPSDYDGLMGVPSTFLDKHNPDQFEVVFNADDMEQTKKYGVEPLGKKRVADYYAAGGTGGNSEGHRKLFLYHPRPWVPFKRIVIRRIS